MTFRLSLTGPTTTVRSELTSSSPMELVMEACNLLEEAGCRFVMSGFGQGAWMLDVA